MNENGNGGTGGSKHPSSTYQRDGPMTVTNNGSGAPNYFPNTFNGPKPNSNGVHKWHSDTVTGDVERVETGDEDNFTQCNSFFNNVLDQNGREHLTSNIAGHLVNASEEIRTRAIANFGCVDPNYGRMISEKIQILIKESGDAPLVREKKNVAPLNPKRDVPDIKSRGECPFGFKSFKF
jgi:catalase